MRLAFYIGHAISFSGKNLFEKEVYGSEISLVRLAQCLSKLGHQIYIFGKHTEEEDCIDFEGVSYRNSLQIYDYGKFDFFIVWRYVHFFYEFDFDFLCDRVIVWVHDTIFHDLWNGTKLPMYGSSAIKKPREKLFKIVCVSETHEKMLKKIYPFIKESKFFVIPNAVGSELVTASKCFSGEKKKNSFIWTSDHSRGLAKVLHLWPRIKKEIPDATLSVYGTIRPEELKIQKELEDVSWFGKIGQNKLFDRLLESEIWFYPTEFVETYCCCALEAQLAGCLVVCSDVGSLKEVVSDRGYIIEKDKDIISQLLDAIKDKSKYQEKARTWASGRTWEKSALLWEKILNE